MKIAYVVHQFPPYHLGGTENYAWSLGRAVANEGHEVHIFYPLAQEQLETRQHYADDLNQWRAPVSSGRQTEGPGRQFWHSIRSATIENEFQLFLDHVQPDLIHIQHLQNVSLKLIELAKAKPIVMTLQDYWYFCANGQLIRPGFEMCQGTRWGANCVDCAAQRGNAPWLTKIRPLAAIPFYLRNRYTQSLVQHIAQFIAPSEFLRQQYIKNGFPADRIQTIEYGLDVERVLPSQALNGVEEEQSQTSQSTDAQESAEATIQWGHSADLHVGFLGSIAPQKGVDVLVRAFNQLPHSARLSIHGSEQAFPEYAESLRQMSHHPGVRFGGPLHHQYTGQAMRSFDCLVIPSIWYENSPLVIQEAFGAGVPVIGSRLGSMPEKIQEQKTGRLFNPGDADDLASVLMDVLNNKAQLYRFKENIEPAPSMKKHAQQILSIYSNFSA